MSAINNILAALGRFFRTVLRSCYDMELYREVRIRPWARSFAYFVLFCVFLVAVTLIDLLPSSWTVLKQARQYVADKVPAAASVTLKSGQLETNLPSPTDLGNDKLAFIIDTSVSGLDAKPVIKSEAGFVFGRDVVVTKESVNERRAVSLSQMPDFSLTKESVLAWIDRYGGWLITAASLIFAAGYFLASLSGGAMFVVLCSLLAALFGSLWRVRLRFGQWVAVGFHAVTLPILVNTLFAAFGLDVPFVFTFLYFMVIVAVIADERAAPVPGSMNAPVTGGADRPPPAAGPAEGPAAAASRPAAKPRPAVRRPARLRARKKPPETPPVEPPPDSTSK